MSLLDLRDRHIIPAINDQELQLGHLLHNSLDEGAGTDQKELQRLQQSIQGLVSLSEFIDQNRHKANDGEYLKQFYSEAERFGLEVSYHERKAIVVGVDTQKTKLQKRRAKKPVAKAQEEEAPAPAPAPVPVQKVPKKPVKKIAGKLKKVVRISPYKWKTDEYGSEGSPSGIYYLPKFRLKTKKADPADLDHAVYAALNGSRPVSAQVSSAAALQTALGHTVNKAVVSLHNTIKTMVSDDKASLQPATQSEPAPITVKVIRNTEGEVHQMMSTVDHAVNKHIEGLFKWMGSGYVSINNESLIIRDVSHDSSITVVAPRSVLDQIIDQIQPHLTKHDLEVKVGPDVAKISFSKASVDSPHVTYTFNNEGQISVYDSVPVDEAIKEVTKFVTTAGGNMKTADDTLIFDDFKHFSSVKIMVAPWLFPDIIDQIAQAVPPEAWAEYRN